MTQFVSKDLNPLESAKLIADYKLLATLATHEDYEVRSAVAWNNKIPIEILTILSQDKETYVRNAVAMNINTPIEVLNVLCADEDIHVQNFAKEALLSK